VVQVAFESPVEDRAEIVVLALEKLQASSRVAAGQRRLSGFGERHVVFGVASSGDWKLAGECQQVKCERADSFEQPKPRLTLGLLYNLEQTLVCQHWQCWQQIDCLP